MRNVRENVIVGDVFARGGKTTGHKEFFNGKMRKLDDSRAKVVDGDQTRTRRANLILDLPAAYLHLI